jgi:hypothetical protein
MRTYPLNPLCNFNFARQKRETRTEIQSEDDPEYGIRLLLGGVGSPAPVSGVRVWIDPRITRRNRPPVARVKVTERD